MRFFVFFLLLFTATVSFSQTTHTALSCSRTDIFNKINEAGVVDGDTVVVPAGTASDWTSGLSITKAITLVGSSFSDGGNEALPEGYTWGTTFVDGITSVSSMITFTLPVGKVGRISQINFQGSSSHSGGEPGSVAFAGFGQYRLDHCKFTSPKTRNVSLLGNATGVADHCWHHNIDGWHAYHFKNGDTYSGSVNGNGAWNEASTIGTAANWFVEDCYFSSASSHYVGICDSWNGGKGVMRRNRSGNAYQVHYSNHGTESAANYRSGRMLEIYQNTWVSTTNHSRVFEMRGGTGVHWGNSFSMPSSSSISFNSYRGDGSNDPPHGPADGTFAWDVADTTDTYGTANDGIFETGTSVVSNCLNRAATVGATITQSGTLITSTLPLFTPAMVGKCIAWTTTMPEGTTTPTIITSFVSSTQIRGHSDQNRTRATPSGFFVGDQKILTDPTKSWGSWVNYIVRIHHEFTGTSGTATTVTVAGAGWSTNEWSGYTITRLSNNEKGSVTSNTSDTITLHPNFYRPSFASGALDFQLSRSGKIVSNNSTSLTIASMHDSYQVFTDPHPFEIRRATFIMDQPGAGASNIPSPTSNPPPQNLSQGHTEPIYNWNNSYNGVLISASGGNYNIQANQDYFNGVSLAVQTTSTSPFNGSVGVGMGTLANRPSSGLATGVGYWATDQGEWDSTNGATADGQLYVATGPTTWVLKYTPYTYPHPLRAESADVTVPTLTSASIDGSTLSLVFSEPVTGVSATNWSLSSGSLSSASGGGAIWSMNVSPAATSVDIFTLNYTPGSVIDASSNALASISSRSVTNNTVPAPSASNRPGRKGRGAGSAAIGR